MPVEKVKVTLNSNSIRFYNNFTFILGEFAKSHICVRMARSKKKKANRRRQMALAIFGRTAHAYVALQVMCLEIAPIENEASYQQVGVSGVSQKVLVRGVKRVTLLN